MQWPMGPTGSELLLGVRNDSQPYWLVLEVTSMKQGIHPNDGTSCPAFCVLLYDR